MAAGMVTRGLLPKQFDKTIDEMFNDGMFGVPDEASEFFSEEAPNGGTYNSYAEVSGLEYAREVGEGEAIDYVVPTEGNEVKRYFTKYGLGYQATLEAVQDERFDAIKQSAKALGKSAAWQYQRSAFALFNGGFDTYKTADGEYIFSDSHATLASGDTLDNKGVVDLSETGMQAMFEYYEGMKMSTGAPDPQKFNKLLIHYKDVWMAQKLLKTTSVIGSANNDILTTNPSNGIMEWTYSIGHYLTDEDAWFGLGADNGLTVSWKMRPEMTSTGDFETDSKMYKTLMRFAVYANRFQALYGSTGAS